MSDDSDLLIAAAATAAVVTWVGTRGRERRASRSQAARAWRARLLAVRTGFARSWRESPGYLFVTGIRDTFFRRKR